VSRLTGVVFVCLFSISVFAQYRWQAPPKDTLGVRLGILSPILFADIKDNKETGAGTPIKYQPNSNSRTALTLFYSHFALTGSVSNPLSDDDKANKGPAKVDDYQFRFYYKYGTWDLFYQNYQGYYIENSGQVDPSFSGVRKIQRPDIKTAHTGIQYFYIPNAEQYSLGGTFDQNIRQIESGGSIYFSGYIGEHSVRADSPLIPTNQASGYGSFANFKDGHFKNVRAGLGYGHTFVFYKFYFGFLFGVSVGQQHQQFDLVSETFDRWVAANGANLKIGTGYNGEKFYSGLQYVMDNTSISFNEYTMGLTSGEYRLFIGTRFDGIPIPPVTKLGEWLYGE